MAAKPADKKTEKAEKPKKEAVEAKKKAKGADAAVETAAKGEKHGEKHAEKHHEEKKKEEHHRAHHAKSTPREDAHCKIKGCKRSYKARGYCKPHYREWRHGKFGVARYKTCKDMNCRKAMGLNRHGYCEEHYTNYYVKGVEKANEAEAAPAVKPAAAKQAAAS